MLTLRFPSSLRGGSKKVRIIMIKLKTGITVFLQTTGINCWHTDVNKHDASVSCLFCSCTFLWIKNVMQEVLPREREQVDLQPNSSTCESRRGNTEDSHTSAPERTHKHTQQKINTELCHKYPPSLISGLLFYLHISDCSIKSSTDQNQLRLKLTHTHIQFEFLSWSKDVV